MGKQQTVEGDIEGRREDLWQFRNQGGRKERGYSGADNIPTRLGRLEG